MRNRSLNDNTDVDLTLRRSDLLIFSRFVILRLEDQENHRKLGASSQA